MQDTKRRIPDTKRCIPDTKRRIPAEGDRIRAYAELCVGQMRCCAMRPVVGKELEAHMEDQKEAYLAEGMPPEEAERLAVVQMGDPVEAGMELDRVHRPRMDWKAVTLICFLAAVGIWLQFIHAGQGGSIQTAQGLARVHGVAGGRVQDNAGGEVDGIRLGEPSGAQGNRRLADVLGGEDGKPADVHKRAEINDIAHGSRKLHARR